MNFKKISLLAVLGLLSASLIGCGQQQGGGEQQPGGEEQEPGGGGEQEPSKVEYTIKFVNGDQELQSGKVEEGQMPVYGGATPTKVSTAEFDYTFAGWEPTIVAATANATYTATFSSAKRSYTVEFKNDDGTVLQSSSVEYGVVPEYTGEEPTKIAVDKVYTFAGWDETPAAVTGNAVYTATYSSVAREYTITFMNGEQQLSQGKVAYGEFPTAPTDEPTKEQTVSTVYTFDGWSSTDGGDVLALLPAVSGDATYYAHFAESVRQYRVDFNPNGGGENTFVMVDYNTPVEAPTAPEKASDAQHIYFFDGWYLGSEAYDFSTPVTGAITLVAHWHEVSATEHGDRCVYTHYAAKAADYVNPGYKEFWVCDLHPELFVLAEPAEHYGDIIEAQGVWQGAIEDSDSRYIAPLEGGNFFARIDLGPSNNNAAAAPVFRTANSYDNVIGFKLKYRISGAFAEGKSSWAGFFFGEENSDVYTAVDASHGGKTIDLHDFDGQWHDLTVRYDGTGYSGYFAFGHALTNFAEGTYIDIDNLVIYGDEVVSEEFTRTVSSKLIESEFVKAGGEAKASVPEQNNRFMRIKLSNAIDHSFAYSFKPYTNITKISFKYRLNKEGGFRDGKTSAWFGVRASSSNQDPDSYQEGSRLWNTKTANTSNASSYFNGLWQNFDVSASDSGFIAFVGCADFKLGTFLDIDDVTIVADGVTYTDDFNSIASLFGASSKADYQQFVSFEVEEQISTDKAFDPAKGELFIYNYAAKNTLVTENVTDPDKGSCVKITEWHGHDTMWLGFPQTASHEELVRGLNGEEPTDFYFSAYNSGASDITLKLRYGSSDYSDRASVTFVAGQWTDFSYKFDSNITDISKFSLAKWVGGDADNQTTICDSNTQLTFTAIYVKHVEIDHDPSEYGAVAYNLKTGSVVAKEYSPTFNQSKGFDETYGPYVQLDNWKCADNQNRCWIAFTGGLVPTADIETALGGQIGGYYMYIYNPLNEDFVINIILNASYVTAKAVTLASKAWTKVSIDLGTYGSETLATADSIGLDHTFASNGAEVGSGWKLTSIFAEKKAVDPAPLGIVALDAQTGSFRDLKGYASTYDLSHGVDDTYGAYMKLDNWVCSSGNSRCWITFSDTAKSVDALETELGGSIGTYFFYIYNPLNADFSMSIMLKSSSGMNPNMNVTLVSHEWTRVEINYNQADNGSYPALTSASQIGLDHTFGSAGAEVGSGWKVTSVYATKA